MLLYRIKSTCVNEKFRTGDLIIDLDKVCEFDIIKRLENDKFIYLVTFHCDKNNYVESHDNEENAIFSLKNVLLNIDKLINVDEMLKDYKIELTPSRNEAMLRKLTDALAS